MSGGDALSVEDDLKRINNIIKNEHSNDYEEDEKLRNNLMEHANKKFTPVTYSEFVREFDPNFNGIIKDSIEKDPNVCSTNFEDTTLQNRVNYHCTEKKKDQSYQQNYKELKAQYIQLARRSLRQ